MRRTARPWGPERRRILRNRSYTVLRGDQAEVRELQDLEELLQVLRDDFGLDFPPGTRFRNPLSWGGGNRP